MLKERENLVNNLVWALDVLIGIAAGFITFGWLTKFDVPISKELNFFHAFILINSYFILRGQKLAQLHRARPYSFLAFRYALYSIAMAGLWIIEREILKVNHFPNHFLAYWIVVHFVMIFFVNFLLFTVLKFFRRHGRNYRNILIVGDDKTDRFINEIIQYPEWGYRIHTIVTDSEVLKEKFKDKIKIIHPSENLEEYIDQNPIDELHYWKDEASFREMRSLIATCSEVGVTFRMKSGIFSHLFHRTSLSYFQTTPTLTLSPTRIDYASNNFKRCFDFIFASIALILAGPLLLTIALLIKMDSKGPVFFAQERVGLRGRRFKVLKFRTMVSNAEELKAKLMKENEVDGPFFKMKKDPRITRIGHFLRKTSLDELPQFINVLKSEMSIVGPRPSLPSEVEQFDRWQLRRLSMKPGITCIWQVSGRNDIAFEDWMRLDLQYIDNWSFTLDMILILKTVRAMFKAEGH